MAFARLTTTNPAELSKLIQTRSQYSARLIENQMVNEEFEGLADDAVVYKLIGPVLVEQEMGEAKSNVAKRLEYISSELARLDQVIEGKEAVVEAAGKKRQSVNQKIYQLQMMAKSAQTQVQQKKIGA